MSHHHHDHSTPCNHDHSHDHGHHHHHHDHAPAPSFALIIPFFKLFSMSAAAFPTKMLGCVLYAFLSISIFIFAYWSHSLSLQIYSLLFIYDLLAIGNEFVSHAIENHVIKARNPSMYSFGLQRLEVVYAFSNAMALFFSGMYGIKEALEAMLDEEDHKHDPTSSFSVLVPILAGALGVFTIRQMSIHAPYYKFLNKTKFSEWTANPFIQAHGLVTTLLLIVHWTQFVYATSPARTQTHVGPAVDALGASAIGLVLMRLSVPVAVAMGKILLQVTPSNVVYVLERACADVMGIDHVIQVTKAQYWSNSFSHQIGILHVQYRPHVQANQLRPEIKDRLNARLPGDWWIQMEQGHSRIL